MIYKLTFETDNYEDYIRARHDLYMLYKSIGSKITWGEAPDYTNGIDIRKPWDFTGKHTEFLIYNKQDLEPRKGYTIPHTATQAADLGNADLTTMSSYDDDNEYPLWVTEENLKAQQEALDNLHKQLAGTPTTPANQIYDPGELSRALDEGYNWAIKNHPDNFKAEHEHKWQRYNGAFRSFDFCEVDGCKMNKDDDGRIWKS